MRLIKHNSQEIICENLNIANGLWQRTLGLMGQKQNQQCLWIKRCNSIHTHFMRFPIDVLYLDKELKVVKVKSNIQPWRFTLPVIGADSVIELIAQDIASKVEEGEKLYVDA